MFHARTVVAAPLVERKGLSLERLVSFLAVADAGGIARAAPGSPVRQSQLSRQIGELERALGTALFERGTQGPRTPTPAGAQLARVVREMLRGLDDVGGAARTERTLCRVGAGDSVLRWLLLPHALRALSLPSGADGGNTSFTLEVGARSSEEAVAELSDASLDIAVVLASTRMPDALKTARLGRIDYALFTRRQRRRQPPALAIVTGEPALAPALATLGEPALRCETFPQAAAAVRAGYAAVLPTIARAELDDIGVRATVTPALKRASTSLVLAWRARLDDVRPALVPLRRRLIALLRAKLAAASRP